MLYELKRKGIVTNLLLVSIISQNEYYQIIASKKNYVYNKLFSIDNFLILQRKALADF